VTKPAVVIGFDDGLVSVYEKAFPTLLQYNIVGTSYIRTGTIGTAGFKSAAQLIEMDGAGWIMGNHTDTHSYLTSLTQSQCEADISTGESKLNALGLTRGSKHVAVPYGAYNATVLAALANVGAKTNRITTVGYNRYFEGMPLKLTCHYITNITTVATVKGWIDEAISRGWVLMLLLHWIVDENADSEIKWLTSQLAEVAAYVRTTGIQSLNIDEYDRLYNDAITVHHH